VAVPPVGFEPAIPANERPQTHALDCAAIGMGCNAFSLLMYVHLATLLVAQFIQS